VAIAIAPSAITTVVILEPATGVGVIIAGNTVTGTVE